MRKRFLYLVTALVLSALFVVPAAAQGPRQDGLQAGQFITFQQTIPINLVFVGYKSNQINKQALLGELPATYEPIVRYPQFYGLNGRDMGLHFDFQYNVVKAGKQFEDQFFSYLNSVGESGPITAFQQQYNDQETNVLDVTGPVLYVDAPSTEQWLMNNGRTKLGIDPGHSYTIFFINWYSRPDFKFHVYTKTDTPDPDTGYNFGEIRGSRKMIAWGGSSGRSWFYDLSAGPEAWTNNYIVDFKDLDGNGVDDARMPPIWEYTAGGYTAPGQLSSDLGKVTRFGAIDLLFTPSPLYDPLVTAPDAGGAKYPFINVFEDDPASNGLDWIDANLTKQRLQSFEPYYSWKIGLEDHDPIDSGALRAYRIWAGLQEEDDCWNIYGTPGAELFCYFDLNRATYLPSSGPDYVGGIFAFSTTDENLGPNFGLLGYADDNWVNGTQTFVFEFNTAGYRDLGYGFTDTTIHEFGHHIALSHPHDGYDSELGVDYGPADEFQYAWIGDESNSVMNYLAVGNEFGQFNRDSMYRYEFAGYLNWSNALLGEILTQPRSPEVRALLDQARQSAFLANASFKRWDYLQAATKARQTYETLLTAASQINMVSQRLEQARKPLPGAQAPHEGDPIRFPDN